MGFYRQRTKCQFLCAPTYGPANDDDAGAASLARILQPRCQQQQRRRPAPFTPLPPSPGCTQQPHPATARGRSDTTGQTQPARHSQSAPTQPARHSPANPSPAGPSSHPASRIHSVTTFSHQPRWCAKPARPVPAQPSGAAQGR